MGANVEAGNAVIYVNINAPPGGNGLTWATAFQDIKSAYQLADPNGSGATTFGQIWVAQGTYYPTHFASANDARSKTFYIFHKNLTVLGGFVGDEADSSQRDFVAHPTILSGDIGVQGDPSDNVRYVLRAPSSSIDATAILDGFTVRDGNANNDLERGGGLLAEGGHPQIRNCNFTNNYAYRRGAGIYSSASLTVTDCTFINNTGAIEGGGGAELVGGTVTNCYFESNSGQVGGLRGATSIDNCTFVNNTGSGGAGGSSGGTMYTDCYFAGNVCHFSGTGGMGPSSSSGTTWTTRCTFVNNVVESSGGGGMSVSGSVTHVITNCVFLGNSSGANGGGLLSSSTGIRMNNCVFSGNTSASGGGAFWCQSGTSISVTNSTFSKNISGALPAGIRTIGTSAVKNCIFWGNVAAGASDQSAQILIGGGTLSLNRSCIKGFTGSLGGVGNIGTDPQFIDPIGDDAVPGTEDDILTLLPGSPCIDAGDNSYIPADEGDLNQNGDTLEPTPYDVDGLPRRYDDVNMPDTGAGTPPVVDMGAHEYDGSSSPPTGSGVFVGPPGGDWFSPRNWAGNAVPTADTNVSISKTVNVNSPGAVARSISIASGGNLVIADADVSVGVSVSIQAGGQLSLTSAGSHLATALCALETRGTLLLDHPSASLDARTLSLQTGATLNWNSGIVNILAHGSLVSASALSIGCNGNSQLNVYDSGTITAPSFQICDMGTAHCDGMIKCNVVNNGHFSPGISTGLLQITGNYSQSVSGTFDVDMSGYSLGTQFDRLTVTGSTT
ncbi:MAG TPA: right-handed parallel beta-helix repeat-containing protein, partial [Phycisphaerales bacterium]|nr:right-handed parallel beta-helix repeat-containing protein [Phycisphaerales bacterium]